MPSKFEIGPVFLEHKVFLYLVNVLPLIFPWKKGMTLHLNKLESPLPKHVLCQICLKLTSGSGEDENVKI